MEGLGDLVIFSYRVKMIYFFFLVLMIWLILLFLKINYNILEVMWFLVIVWKFFNVYKKLKGLVISIRKGKKIGEGWG